MSKTYQFKQGNGEIVPVTMVARTAKSFEIVRGLTRPWARNSGIKCPFYQVNSIPLTNGWIVV